MRMIRILLESGQYHKALKLAETVLQAKADIGFYFCKYFQNLICSCNQLFAETVISTDAIYVKAQSLFNLCDFEHSLIMFHRGDKLDSNTKIFQ